MAALDGFDRLKRALVSIIDARLRARGVDYLALYPARVAAQNVDGSLELVPDDPRFKGLSRVAIRPGLPAVTLEIEKDSRVLFGFEGGDRSRPYASIWDASVVKSMTIRAATKVVVIAPSVELGDEGGSPVARVGDTVACVLPPQMPVSGVMTVPPAPPAAFSGMLTVVDPVLGVIEGGASRAKAS
ncbi:MAG TPA: hypothetical protein VFS43_00675 [Polyangiaceae bacterium]|nr:hypothetical protein [Polyangiaceae bacterium]